MKEGSTQGRVLAQGSRRHNTLCRFSTQTYNNGRLAAGLSSLRSLCRTVHVDVCRCPGPLECLFVEAGLFCVKNVRKASARVC